MSEAKQPSLGPNLETYVETRLNLLTEAIKDSAAAQGSALGSAIEMTKAAIIALEHRLGEYDLRYQQRYESSQKAVEAAFSAQKEAINAALAAADRAVTKAELATEKRFESVNEFRATLDNQQRTLIPRSEVVVMVEGINEKIVQVTKQVDHLLAERQGVRGGWGYAVGVVGFMLALLALAASLGWGQ